MTEPGTRIGDLGDDEREQYSRQLIAKASRRVAMLACHDQKSGKTFGNGTGSLIRLRGGSFIVTNHHVWEMFLEIKKSEPNVSLILIRHDSGGDSIDLSEIGVDISEARVVALDEELDLAVLEYCSAEIEEAGKEYYDLSSSPAIRATAQVGQTANRDLQVQIVDKGIARSRSGRVGPDQRDAHGFARVDDAAVITGRLAGRAKNDILIDNLSKDG